MRITFIQSRIVMAQMYNQKRNVYSIDQILGHGKEDGKYSFFFNCYQHFQNMKNTFMEF